MRGNSLQVSVKFSALLASIALKTTCLLYGYYRLIQSNCAQLEKRARRSKRILATKLGTGTPVKIWFEEEGLFSTTRDKALVNKR